MKTQLIKVFDNDSDYAVVVYEKLDGNRAFVVAVHDTVTDLTVEQYQFFNKKRALKHAQEINNAYNFD